MSLNALNWTGVKNSWQFCAKLSAFLRITANRYGTPTQMRATQICCLHSASNCQAALHSAWSPTVQQLPAQNCWWTLCQVRPNSPFIGVEFHNCQGESQLIFWKWFMFCLMFELLKDSFKCFVFFNIFLMSYHFKIRMYLFSTILNKSGGWLFISYRLFLAKGHKLKKRWRTFQVDLRKKWFHSGDLWFTGWVGDDCRNSHNI